MGGGVGRLGRERPLVARLGGAVIAANLVQVAEIAVGIGVVGAGGEEAPVQLGRRVELSRRRQQCGQVEQCAVMAGFLGKRPVIQSHRLVGAARLVMCEGLGKALAWIAHGLQGRAPTVSRQRMAGGCGAAPC